MMGKANKSDINFKAWSEVATDSDLVDKELRIQKKRHFKLPSTMPTQIQSGKSVVQFATPSVSSTA